MVTKKVNEFPHLHSRRCRHEMLEEWEAADEWSTQLPRDEALSRVREEAVSDVAASERSEWNAANGRLKL